MNRRSLYDSIDPGLILPPTDTVAIKKFLYFRWYCSCDTSWPWKPENSLNRLWPLEENLAYTNQELKTAGMGGFPLGDLFHWWPAEYSQWEAQEENENARISYWLNEGKDSVFTDVKKGNNIVSKFELLQNYPNPFNPTTNIKFRIAEIGLVTLKVFDILGREVATLIDEEKPAGQYTINFNAAELASGVYFYQLKAGNFLRTKKLLLLK
ncbi:MAG: T9SS type A sorting domain-containing protein [Ignavibacteriaceae bacterium]